MELLLANGVLFFFSVVFLPFLKGPKQSSFARFAALILALTAMAAGTLSLTGTSLQITLSGNAITGPIPLRIDALSGWFLILINFTLATGAAYGAGYMRMYQGKTLEKTIHWMAFLTMQAALTFSCVVQNSLVFLIILEIMAISTFLLVIFEHHKKETLRSGINYLIQAHLSVLFLTIGFVWVAARTGSYDFEAMADFASGANEKTGLALLLCMLVGFGFKSGFVPFHTWLPYAHPAAPAHVSGVMSGVIIKVGIYGLMRTILLVQTDYTVFGYILLFLSVITGGYGVLLAIIQHNLKKLLAYHSIENIGIIGIGLGIGCLGLGYQNPALSVLGFGGALLHTFNHSLFKSLLFYTAGSVYHAVHELNVEKLGGLIKQMPRTAFLFLVAALAICGLPPFNGFISEFLIYTGLFRGLSHTPFAPLSLMTALLGLVFIGGLAMLCFTKAFGIVFLGHARTSYPHPPREVSGDMLIPQYFTLALIVSIGLFPTLFFQILEVPVRLFSFKLPAEPRAVTSALFQTGSLLTSVSMAAIGFLALSGVIYFFRKRAMAGRVVTERPTWGCGYTGESAKMQYTASSFVRTYRKLLEPFFLIRKHKKEIQGIFPEDGQHEIHTGDKLEELFIDIPQKWTFRFFDKWKFLQNGNPQYYLLYGALFILFIMAAPMAWQFLSGVVGFFNQI